MHFFQKHGQAFYWKSKNKLPLGGNAPRHRTRAGSEISPPPISYAPGARQDTLKSKKLLLHYKASHYSPHFFNKTFPPDTGK